MLFDSTTIYKAGNFSQDFSPLREVIDTIAPVFEKNHPELLKILYNAESLFKDNKTNTKNSCHNISYQASVLAYAFHMFEIEASFFLEGVNDKKYRNELRIPELMIASCITNYDYGSKRNKNTNREDNVTKTEEENSFFYFIEDYKKAYGGLSDFESAGIDLNLVRSLVIITRTSDKFFGYSSSFHRFRDIMRRDEFILDCDFQAANYEPCGNDDPLKYIQDVCVSPYGGRLTFAAKAISDANLAPLFYMGLEAYNFYIKRFYEERGEDMPYNKKILEYIDKIVGLPLLGMLDNDSLISIATIRKNLDNLFS